MITEEYVELAYINTKIYKSFELPLINMDSSLVSIRRQNIRDQKAFSGKLDDIDIITNWIKKSKSIGKGPDKIKLLDSVNFQSMNKKDYPFLILV